jgi:DNA-directed RNA polymerase subunit RPC12/RpoP
MCSNEFIPLGVRSIRVRFLCSNCGDEILSNDIRVPNQDYESEISLDAVKENTEITICSNCQKEFKTHVSVNVTGGWVNIDNINKENILSVITNLEKAERDYDERIKQILTTSETSRLFFKETEQFKTNCNLEHLPISTQKILIKKCYVALIAYLEQYMASVLIQKVYSNEEYLKRYIKTFPYIRQQKFNLSEIYDKIHQVNDIVKKELLNTSYRNLSLTNCLYKNVFGIELPDFRKVNEIINTFYCSYYNNIPDEEITMDKFANNVNTIEEFVKELESLIESKQTSK